MVIFGIIYAAGCKRLSNINRSFIFNQIETNTKGQRVFILPFSKSVFNEIKYNQPINILEYEKSDDNPRLQSKC